MKWGDRWRQKKTTEKQKEIYIFFHIKYARTILRRGWKNKAIFLSSPHLFSCIRFPRKRGGGGNKKSVPTAASSPPPLLLPQPATVACKMEAQSECAHVAHTFFLHVCAPTRMLGWHLLTKISASELSRKSIKSALSVGSAKQDLHMLCRASSDAKMGELSSRWQGEKKILFSQKTKASVLKKSFLECLSHKILKLCFSFFSR